MAESAGVAGVAAGAGETDVLTAGGDGVAVNVAGGAGAAQPPAGKTNTIITSNKPKTIRNIEG